MFQMTRDFWSMFSHVCCRQTPQPSCSYVMQKPQGFFYCRTDDRITCSHTRVFFARFLRQRSSVSSFRCVESLPTRRVPGVVLLSPVVFSEIGIPNLLSTSDSSNLKTTHGDSFSKSKILKKKKKKKTNVVDMQLDEKWIDSWG